MSFNVVRIQIDLSHSFMAVPPGLEDGWLTVMLPYGRPSGTQSLYQRDAGHLIAP